MLKKKEVERMREFMQSQPRAIDKKIEYGPEEVKKTYTKRSKKNGR
tara:strand:- start:4691 stop:4828 length:138 start_codon:yes stop_codon:yes gene_type:complete